MVIMLKDDSSVRNIFCAIFVHLPATNVPEKHGRSSSYLVFVFFKENSHSNGTFTEQLFLLQLLYTKFFEPIFFRTPISGW